MATNSEQSRHERFTEWNPYASMIEAEAQDHDDLPTQTTLAELAIAFELSQIRAAIHFATKGRPS
jgi:hypothetical protein